MAKKKIPDTIREQAAEIVEQFNLTVLSEENQNQAPINSLGKLLSVFGFNRSSESSIYYSIRFRGQYMYLDRTGYGRSGQICRLKYNGEIDNWDFAIYKYSKERYDPDEWFFPGTGHLNGTIEGAMRAGLEAYPP